MEVFKTGRVVALLAVLETQQIARVPPHAEIATRRTMIILPRKTIPNIIIATKVFYGSRLFTRQEIHYKLQCIFAIDTRNGYS